MNADGSERLAYAIESEAPPARCRVVLSGAITRSNGCEVLLRLWSDSAYANNDSAIWDVSACELPDFNDLLAVAKFINQEKAGRGPNVVAFCSPAFASSTLARAFRGFDRVINLDLNFFGTIDDARAWLDQRAKA